MDGGFGETVMLSPDLIGDGIPDLAVAALVFDGGGVGDAHGRLRERDTMLVKPPIVGARQRRVTCAEGRKGWSLGKASQEEQVRDNRGLAAIKS